MLGSGLLPFSQQVVGTPASSKMDLLKFKTSLVRSHDSSIYDKYIIIIWIRSNERDVCILSHNIRKTCLYIFYPLKPHFYIVKLGFIMGIHYFFLFLLKNIDCGYSLEPPHRGGSNECHNLCFEQKYEKKKVFYLKIFSFWRWKFLYIWISMFS